MSDDMLADLAKNWPTHRGDATVADPRQDLIDQITDRLQDLDEAGLQDLLDYLDAVGEPATPTPAADPEKAKVEAFAESVGAQSLQAAGYDSPKAFVRKFTELRRRNRDLTAEAFGIPAPR